jgi:uncharacterized protein (DUF983 family)
VVQKQRRSRLAAIAGLRCPRCLEGRLFTGVWAMRTHCPVCNLHFGRESGYFVGAMFFSYGAAVPLIGTLAVAIWWFWRGLQPYQIILLALAGFLPFVPLIFRYSRVMWLHMDWLFDPW